MAVDRILHRHRPRGGIEVRDDLVPVEIEVDPVIGRSPFGTAHHPPVEIARGGEIMDRKGEVEGAQRHARLIHRRQTW